jgi:quinol monooxygenase YgiN
MYMRVTRGRVDPSGYDDLMGLAPDIRASVSRQPGCQSYTQGGDRASGKTIALSTWDTEEHARMDRNTALADVLPRVQATGVQLDPPDIYEVVSG